MIWSVGSESDCIVAHATTMLSKKPVLPLKEKHVVEKSLPQFIQRPRRESGRSRRGQKLEKVSCGFL